MRKLLGIVRVNKRYILFSLLLATESMFVISVSLMVYFVIIFTLVFIYPKIPVIGDGNNAETIESLIALLAIPLYYLRKYLRSQDYSSLVRKKDNEI